MAIDRETLDLVAACLDYPRRITPSLARRAAERLAGDHIELARAFWELAVWLETSPLGEAEERYTTLFDLQPVCTLHAGYQVFGDTYQRGEVLAGLAGELKRADVGVGEELPDFVPTLLRLSARLGDEDRRALAETLLLPALFKIVEALEASQGPWCSILRALPPVILEHSGADANALLPPPPLKSPAEAALHA
jgi:nitrate reductase delta subunit